MPNYRQKNRNRNRNKNRNKLANQQQKQQQQQQQHSPESLKVKEEEKGKPIADEKENEGVEKLHGKEEIQPTAEELPTKSPIQPVEQVAAVVVSNVEQNVKAVKLIESENESLGNDSTIEQPSTATAKAKAKAPAIVEDDARGDNASNDTRKNVEQNVKDSDKSAITASITAATSVAAATETTKTESADPVRIANDEMGAKGSRLKDDDRLGSMKLDDSIRNRYKEMQPLRTIMATLEEQERQEKLEQKLEQHVQQERSEPHIIIHRIEREESNATAAVAAAAAVAAVAAPPTTQAENNINAQSREVKVIFHRIELETEANGSAAQRHNVNSTVSSISPTQLEQRYHVQSPINELGSKRHSACSSILIQELSDGNSSDTNESSNEHQAAPLVSEVDDSESEREAETTATTPTKPTTAAEAEAPSIPAGGESILIMPLSSIGSSCQDDLRQRRVQKRAALESHFLPQLICPRYLDCILEENSEQQTDGKNNFAQTPPQSPGAFTVVDSRARRADARFPKSNLDFSRKHKHGQLPKAPTMPGAICEEPQTIIVETKNIEKSVVFQSSNRTSTEESEDIHAVLTSATIESASDPAEVVFIDSASSSMSDLLEEFSSSAAHTDADMDDDYGAADESNADADADADGDDTTLSALDLETDVSDAISSTERNSSAASTLTGGSRENTPVNQSTATSQSNALANTIEPNDGGGGSSVEDRKFSSDPYNNSVITMDSFSFRDGAVANYEQKYEASASAATTTTKTIDCDDDDDGQRTKEPLRSTCDSGERVSNSGSCNLSAAENVDAKSLLETLEAEMSNVRNVLSSLEELTVTPPVAPIRRLNVKRNATSQSPPPLPPPPTYLDADIHYPLTQNSSNNVDTTQQNNHLEQLNNQQQNQQQQQQKTPKDTQLLSQNPHEASVAELEKPPTPANSANGILIRQESNDSHRSDSTVHSQCTAINLCASPPPQESEFVVPQPTSPTKKNSSSYISDASCEKKPLTAKSEVIKKLRLLCTETLASMPYGEFVLEELANVAQDLSKVQLKQRQDLELQFQQHQQRQRQQQQQQQQRQRHEQQREANSSKMPYPLPDMPKIDQLEVAATVIGQPGGKIAITPTRPAPPPPAQSATLSTSLSPSVQSTTTTMTSEIDSSWLGMPTEMDPKILVCLSPAQRAYIEEEKSKKISTNHQPDALLDAHQKYIDRRGYHEYTKDQVRAINIEKLKEQQVLETAAAMKKLRKSMTPPPPPVPPPPIPLKSCETAAKAQSQKKTMTTTATATAAMAAAAAAAAAAALDDGKNDVIAKNANDQFSAFSNVGESIISSDSDDNNNGKSNNKKNRLLSIIHDNTTKGNTNENEVQKNKNRSIAAATTTSSYESISKQVTIQNNSNSNSSNSARVAIGSSQEAPFQSNAQQVEHSRGSENSIPNSTKAPSTATSSDMQSVESDLARMFPTMGERNIFDVAQKRYSNIESSSKTAPFCTQLTGTQPKRFSSAFETHSYETKKRTENGAVVYDYADSKHEAQSNSDGVGIGLGDVHPPAPKVITHFPVKVDGKYAPTAPAADAPQRHQQVHSNDSKKMPSVSTSHVDEIMSALKLNTKNIATDATAPATAPPYFPTATAPPAAGNSLFTSVTAKQRKSENEQAKENAKEREVERIEKTFEERYESAERNSSSTSTSTSKRISTAKVPFAGSYEEFRQRAKAAADAIYTGNDEQRQPSTFHSVDHEKLYKDFDELSKQLNATLEAGKPQTYGDRVGPSSSSTLNDLNRMQMQFNRHIKDLKLQRHEHMMELEREIERSMRSRHLRQQQDQHQHDQTDHHELTSIARTHDIPIRIENAQRISPCDVKSSVTSQQQSYYHDKASELRRTESMGNLPTSPLLAQQAQQQQQQHVQMHVPKQRERSYSNNAVDDDWSRYASDLGNSENITRPFVREVEICYQKQPAPPRTIRAPRLTASATDLYNNNSYTETQSYDCHNAYNVRRTHAPMMGAVAPLHALQKTKPQYLSCYSVLERDPNPTYISTTSRRGVSPAPPAVTPPQSAQSTSDHVHFRVSEREMRQRRMSLPRELQAQQLKYIQSKEDELKTEFERLQSERRRLMEEMQREAEAHAAPAESHAAPTAAPAPPVLSAPRQAYRPVPPRRLPTLSEDEVFRQQMAEEWLSKVAEREDRRLHNIIKLSKAANATSGVRHVPIALPASAPPPPGTTEPDIEREFLKRVQERRHKLAMPHDSDWESGAESHPQPNATAGGHTSDTDELPTIKIIEGKSEADLRHLPKHLREFAKFSNHHQTEQIGSDGGQRELHQEEEERKQEATDNSYSSASKKSSVMKTVKITRQHPYAQSSSNIPNFNFNFNGDQHGRYPYKSSGYQSEPEPNYDSDHSILKYRTVDKNRLQSVSSAANIRDEKLYGTMPNSLKSSQPLYKNQPGRIENYTTGHSSISEKEKKEHFDQTKVSPHYTEGNLSRALAKESGYTSDSNLVFRKKDFPPGSLLSPIEQKQAYKSLQYGAEPPLLGFRKPAPEKPKDQDNAPPVPPKTYSKQGDLPSHGLNGNIRSESPNRYLESDVNIHFKTPVRHEYKDPIPEAELALRQAEQMQKLYQEERRRKYLQELQDMNSRRHTDNFTPSQKSPIPLNRYDDFPSDLAKSGLLPRTVARALYNFQGQNVRELSFRKGDLIYLRRQIDKNWYEGEHNGVFGLLPSNYIEIINKEAGRPQTKRPSEGQARAKYNFQAQSGVELSLNKGELVTLTRRVDENWFEGKIANRKGIFPVSYVEVLADIGAEDNELRTVASEYSTTNLRPSLDVLRTNINNEFNIITQNGQQAPNGILKGVQHKTEALHVDTSSTPLTYRALYKYRPQNSDELELLEGDLVHVLEKCDDGWFVGTSQRTGCFGTFPGNYVERI